MSGERSETGTAHGHHRAPVEVRLLGPLEVVGAAGDLLNVGTRKQRALLTILALARGQVVSADRMVGELWGDEPPAQALASLYPYVSNLRRLLEPRRDAPPSVLVTVPPGYVLRLGPDAVDAVRFEDAAQQVSSRVAAGDWAGARALAVEALGWWRGPALGEFASETYAELDAIRLEELRLAMREDLFEARLAHSDGHLVGDVERFVGEHPLRERGWALLMRALYAAGRQSDALRAYQRVRTHLLDELGVEPGPQLRHLEQAILSHDDDLPVMRRSGHPTPLHDDRSAAPGYDPHTEPDAESTPARGRLVGRGVELGICRGVLDEVDSGPRAVIVEGEPGIGKTRLVEELATVAEQRGMLVVWGRAFEGGAAPAFWPWLPALRTLVDLVPDDTSATELAALLSTSPPAAGGNVEPARFALFDTIAELLERVAGQRHLMIVLDDLQWADVASLELVVALTNRLNKPGVLLAATTRELEYGRNDGLVAALAALTRMTGSRRLQLQGLDHDHTAELLTAVTGTAIEPATAAATYHRADGNPFFTTELARLLTEPSGGSVGDIPTGVRDVIRRRLEPLPTDTIEVLQVAGVIGRDVELNLLARASGHEIIDCLEALEPAVLQRLIVHLDERPGSYRFIHALVREVLVDDLSPMQLAVEHLRIADAIGDDDDTAEIAAEHLWAATPLGVGRRAAEMLERAARVAISRTAYEAAEHRLERAAALHRSAADDAAELHALGLMASAAAAHRGYATFNDSPIIARARELGAHTGNDVDYVMLLWGEWAGRAVACQLDLAEKCALDLLALAETSDHPLVRAVAHTSYGITCWHHGRLAEAVGHLEDARAVAGEAQRSLDNPLLGSDELLLAGPFSVYIRDLMGDVSSPAATNGQLRREIPGDRLWSVIVSIYAAASALMVGDHGRATREALIGIDADPDGIYGFWSSLLRANLGATLCASGDTTAGVPMFESAWNEYTETGHRTSGPAMLANVAIGLARGDRLDEAGEAMRRARHELDTYGELYTEPIVLLAEAVVAAAHHDDRDRIIRLLDQALTSAERQGARAVTAHIRRTADTLGLPVLRG